MAPLDVLPLDKAKDYLNIRTTQNDAELESFIPPAVERVERHIAGRAGVGVTLVNAESCTESEILACKVALAEYWRTQRAQVGRGGFNGGGSSGAAIEADSGPDGRAPLRVRLTEILGVPPFLDGESSSQPRGAFPPPPPWPDPFIGCGWPR